jgi:hypothetical protein
LGTRLNHIVRLGYDVSTGTEENQESFRSGLEQKFRMIQSLATGHLKSNWVGDSRGEYRSAEGIVATYEAARQVFEERIKGTGLLEVISMSGYSSYEYDTGEREIRMVISNSAAAVGFLAQDRQQVSTEVRNKLDALLGQIAEVQQLSPNLYAHLAESVKEHEATHYLASSVLAAKSIDYVLAKLPGDNEISKAEFLVSKGLLKKELKDGWVLTWKKARNYYVHDLSAIPASAESLSLVTQACELGLAYTKANLS